MTISSYKGCLTFSRPLEESHYQYLLAFANTLRVARKVEDVDAEADIIRINPSLPLGKECEFYTGSFNRTGKTSIINDYRTCPKTQPSSWCCWYPDKGKNALLISDVKATTISYINSFEYFEPWLIYIINNFIKPWGYSLSGKMKVHNYYNPNCIKSLSVTDNEVIVTDLAVFS